MGDRRPSPGDRAPLVSPRAKARGPVPPETLKNIPAEAIVYVSVAEIFQKAMARYAIREGTDEQA